jgi:hypothetical protein
MVCRGPLLLRLVRVHGVFQLAISSFSVPNAGVRGSPMYPFVLPPAVLGKMRFVHNAIDELSRPRIADRALGLA